MRCWWPFCTERDKTTEPRPLPSTVFMTRDLDKVCPGYLAKPRNRGAAEALRVPGDGGSASPGGDLLQGAVALAVKQRLNTLDLEAVPLLQCWSHYSIRCFVSVWRQLRFGTAYGDTRMHDQPLPHRAYRAVFGLVYWKSKAVLI